MENGQGQEQAGAGLLAALLLIDSTHKPVGPTRPLEIPCRFDFIAAFTGGFVVATFIAAQNLGGIVWR